MYMYFWVYYLLPLNITVAKNIWKAFSSSGPNLASGFVFHSFQIKLVKNLFEVGLCSPLL